uniref:BTB domain-containing protein n=1 Tax=Panagrolaimus sp. ES5 TaxID=591445 RepID=A0AC34GUH1_9BILA
MEKSFNLFDDVEEAAASSSAAEPNKNKVVAAPSTESTAAPVTARQNVMHNSQPPRRGLSFGPPLSSFLSSRPVATGNSKPPPALEITAAGSGYKQYGAFRSFPKGSVPQSIKIYPSEEYRVTPKKVNCDRQEQDKPRTPDPATEHALSCEKPSTSSPNPSICSSDDSTPVVKKWTDVTEPSDDKMIKFSKDFFGSYGGNCFQTSFLPLRTVDIDSNKLGPITSDGKNTVSNAPQVKGPIAEDIVACQPGTLRESTLCTEQVQHVVAEKTDQKSNKSATMNQTSQVLQLGPALSAIPGKDFYFKVHGDNIAIHKLVLAARSPYFYKQFYENSGAPVDFVKIEDFDKEIVDLVVKVCYGERFDEATLDGPTAEQIFKFASTYDIPRLSHMLPTTISKLVTEENVCSLAIRALETNDVALVKKCAAYVAGLIAQEKKTPRGIDNLPAIFDKEVIRAIVAAQHKK